jgi:hypothetical protein
MASEEEYSFELEGSSCGARYVQVYIQHSGEPDQSTSIMLMDGKNIIFQTNTKEIEKFISELSSKWKGKKPVGLP